MTQKTVLNDAHRRFGAKMVDFGGWDMPLHYGSQLEEHHTVRRDCGMFDVSHMCAVDVAGPDAKAFFLRLIANNVDKLKLPGKALYSAMLNESGGVVDDLIVYYLADNVYRVVINAGTAEKDLAWMAARLAEWGLKLDITPRRDLAMIAVQGWIDRERLKTKLVMQVHDELVLEVPDDELMRVRVELPPLMTQVAKLRVPLVVEVGVGANWDEAH